MTYMLETTFLIRSPTSKLYMEKKRLITIFNRPTVCKKAIADINMSSQLCIISNLGNCTEIKPDFTTKATENPQVFPSLAAKAHICPVGVQRGSLYRGCLIGWRHSSSQTLLYSDRCFSTQNQKPKSGF